MEQENSQQDYSATEGSTAAEEANPTQAEEVTATVTEIKEVDQDLDTENHEKSLEKAMELKNQGNALYKESDFTEAVNTYREALLYCPMDEIKNRSILYSNMAQCLHRTKNYDDCIELATKSIKIDETYIKPLITRAKAYLETEKLEESLEDWQQAEKLDPTNYDVTQNLYKLTKKVEADREKKKEEVLGNLKDLGNTLLGKFGFSLDNFKMEKNESGSYNIQFQK